MWLTYITNVPRLFCQREKAKQNLFHSHKNPAYHFDGSGSTLQFDADPCGSGSATLAKTVRCFYRTHAEILTPFPDV
jgi:hypothetical protein